MCAKYHYAHSNYPTILPIEMRIKFNINYYTPQKLKDLKYGKYEHKVFSD